MTDPATTNPAGSGGVSDGPLLEVRDAEVAYGAVTAVRGISLRVEAGEVVALLGANGAGKTTTLRMISGLLPPARGAVWFDGTCIAGAPLPGPAPAASSVRAARSVPPVLPVRTASAKRTGRVSRGRHRDAARHQDAARQRDVPGLPVHRVTALGISHVPEGRRIFPAMTVAENLAMGAYLDRRRDRAETRRGLDRVNTLFPRLAERSRQPAGTLSGGEQQMLAIGRALMARPRLILLDEPSLGLAPLLVATIFEVIREINAGGTTVLLVEQNAAAALRIAHRGYVLDTGEVVLAGSADALARDARVRDAYLGSSDEPHDTRDRQVTG
ncbi:ABC transporter ATP-binding protein [Parafrankia elaeagni]|uniref:ABC transporter ATP-binding protein n=1 Tax=Parafrankia elaeagni TaxID=222534 RepID=UPI0003810889|nr:ABC transporter ATP-binding protein [Parafrankia elaeagni]